MRALIKDLSKEVNYKESIKVSGIPKTLPNI